MRLPAFIASCIATAAAAFGAGYAVPADLPALADRVAALAAGAANAGSGIDGVAVEIPDGSGGISRISVARHEVTVGEWRECVDAGACAYSPERRGYVGDDHPVSGVSWRDAQQYIAWRSERDGVRYRLPLEGEWRELAIDVLDEKVDKLFDDPRLAWAADYANFSKRAERRTRPAGSFGAEANGVADIAGNVWEWTDSCWRSPAGDGRNCGGVRVLAGTHMTYQSELVRVVPVGGCSIGFPPANIGFRLVRDLEPPARAAETG